MLVCSHFCEYTDSFSLDWEDKKLSDCYISEGWAFAYPCFPVVK